MSYCRFSNDDYQCDVYTYQDVAGGWTTHVGSVRRLVTETLPPRIAPLPGTNDVDYLDWSRRESEVAAIIARSPTEPIGGPCDSQTYSDPTPGLAAVRLENLRTAGYRVPQRAIDALQREEGEGITNPPMAPNPN